MHHILQSPTKATGKSTKKKKRKIEKKGTNVRNDRKTLVKIRGTTQGKFGKSSLAKFYKLNWKDVFKPNMKGVPILRSLIQHRLLTAVIHLFQIFL